MSTDLLLVNGGRLLDPVSGAWGTDAGLVVRDERPVRA
jgi:hypothetical protein